MEIALNKKKETVKEEQETVKNISERIFLLIKINQPVRIIPLAMVVPLTAHQMASTPIPVCTSSKAAGMRM